MNQPFKWLHKSVMMSFVLLTLPEGFFKTGESRDPADDCGPSETVACHGRKRYTDTKVMKTRLKSKVYEFTACFMTATFD